MVLKFYNLGNSWKSNPTLNIYIFFVYSSCKLSVPESAWTAAHKGQLYKND